MEEDEDYGEDALHSLQPRARTQTRGESFFTNDPNDNTVLDNDVEVDAIDVHEEAAEDEVDAEKDVQDLMYPTEVDRKKERRKERAW